MNSQLLTQQQRADKNHQIEQEMQEQPRVEAKVRHLNTVLEQEVQVRTWEYQQALNFAAILKHISDRVRDSLEQQQILQTVVTELASALALSYGDGVLYSPEKQTPTLRAAYGVPLFPEVQEQRFPRAEAPEIYQHLQCQRDWVAFCPLHLGQLQGSAALLVSPICDDQGVLLGDLWLFKEADANFGEWEICLVQQVTRQCTIALRQARLYQASQSQVQELERLHRLKDDFISTAAHELRAPLASIKMAIYMLETSLAPLGVFTDESKMPHRYFKILQKECQREMTLINDLLELTHLEMENPPLVVSTIEVQGLLPSLVAPFAERIQAQQQRLDISIPPELPPMTTDVSYLERILRELLHNACKYTPIEETIRLSAQANPTTWEIQVSNSGVEIPETEQERIFDKFYRIPHRDPWQSGGTGLGLALVKTLAERLGGNIQVKSSNGQTSFILKFGVSPPSLA